MDHVRHGWWLTVLSAVLASCHKSEGPPQTTEPPVAAPEAKSTPDPPGTRVDIGVPIDDPDRWLFVEGHTQGASGGWATGSFDPQRNKLTIQTKDVTKFVADTSRIRIDWKRLVVLSIDGKNSELRKREFELYHFVRTDHGEWVVVEP